MRSDPAPQTKRQQLGERSRQEILDAATRLMGARGYDGVSIAQIAKASGLPASSIYWHFDSKAGVLEAVMERGADRFFAAVDEPLPADEGATPRDILRAQMSRSAAALSDEPDFLRLFILLLLSRGRDETVERVRRQGRERISRQISAAFLARGDSFASDAAKRLTDLAIAMFDGAFLATQSDPHLELEPLLLQAADAIALLGEEPAVDERG